MQMIYERFIERYADMDTIVQAPDMSEDEREGFLERFDSGNPATLVGFAVMGGIFSEGIDLVGRRLTGAAVVGVGLPGICLERELIRDHFAEIGFDYAYTFPGINRVMQAAGRVIRSERDQGSLLLIDSRYATYRYKTLLPNHWRTARIASSGSLRRNI
jgi:Rad3-related DNA helicase